MYSLGVHLFKNIVIILIRTFVDLLSSLWENRGGWASSRISTWSPSAPITVALWQQSV
jgi:hypothetical protein